MRLLAQSRICPHCRTSCPRLVFVVETVLYIVAPQAPAHQLLEAQPHLSCDNQKCLQTLPDALITPHPPWELRCKGYSLTAVKSK